MKNEHEIIEREERVGRSFTEDDLKEELTPEQWEEYLSNYEKFGFEEAIERLPEIDGTQMISADVMNSILKKLRVAHNLTQNDLANYLNISRQKYNCYERQGYNVHIARLVQIAIFYNISLDCFTMYYPKYKPFYYDMSPNDTPVIKFILEHKKKITKENLPNTEEIYNNL